MPARKHRTMRASRGAAKLCHHSPNATVPIRTPSGIISSSGSLDFAFVSKLDNLLINRMGMLPHPAAIGLIHCQIRLARSIVLPPSPAPHFLTDSHDDQNERRYCNKDYEQI